MKAVSSWDKLDFEQKYHPHTIEKQIGFVFAIKKRILCN